MKICLLERVIELYYEAVDKEDSIKSCHYQRIIKNYVSKKLMPKEEWDKIVDELIGLYHEPIEHLKHAKHMSWVEFFSKHSNK